MTLPMIQKCPPGFTVLVVEPDATCLTIISKMLSVSGHQVVTANGGLDALHIIWRKEVEIDLVLTEENLPDIRKYDLLDAIKKLFYLPFVVMSGFRDDMVGSLDAGAKFHILKPVTWRNVMDLWLFSIPRKRAKGLLPVGESPFIEKQYPEKYLPSSRQKTVWTDDLHDRFLRVVQIICMHDSNPSPDEILLSMNVPCLTREHISRHLLKYRLISRLEKERILDAIADQQTRADCGVPGGQHHQSLKRKPMSPGSIRGRLWHYNHGTASSSGSNATPCQQLVEQSPYLVKQEPEEGDQATQKLPSAPPPPEEQVEDDKNGSFSDD